MDIQPWALIYTPGHADYFFLMSNPAVDIHAEGVDIHAEGVDIPAEVVNIHAESITYP